MAGVTFNTPEQYSLDVPLWGVDAQWQLCWPDDPALNDAFLRELIASPPVQRLRRIAFLGAIAYLLPNNARRAHHRRHSRFDHSVNVALLALHYALVKELDLKQRRLLAAAALLHDVGHGPLSHTLEPVFARLFAIDHHAAGAAILKGATPLGASIARIFSAFEIDVDEVIALIDGTHPGEHAFLFASPMNLDTIEGITRCYPLCGIADLLQPMAFIDAIATQAAFPTETGDLFWLMKSQVYQAVILSRSGLVADTLAQQCMLQAATYAQPEDFFLDDTQLSSKHPRLRHLLREMRLSPAGFHVAQADNFDLESMIDAPSRSFSVDMSVPVTSPEQLAARYTQRKSTHRFTLKTLLTGQCEQNLLRGSGGLNLLKSGA